MGNINEKELILKMIGIFEAIEKKTITIEEGEDILFSPKNIKKLEQDGCDSRIIAIIWEACELEDIESLLPMRLDEIINDLKDKSLELLRINFEKNQSD